jgi:fibronectin type 3 domain-containing protein
VSASDGDNEDAVLVTWQASAGATSYDVYRATSPEGAKTKVATATDTTYTDTRVTCDAVYFYWIQALNLCSTSPFSNSDSGYPHCLVPPDGTDTPDTTTPDAPSTPTGVSASDGLYTDRVLISWQAAAAATSYDIYRSDRFAGEKIKITSTRGTSFSDRNIPVSTTFFYWVKAKNAAGNSEFSNFDTGYRLCPPAPTSISASKDTYIDRIRVTWSASRGAVEYDIYRSIFAAAPESMRTRIATVNSTSYDDMFELCVVNCSSCSTSSSKPFYYWVTARSADCTSPFSGTDSGYIHCKPAVPTGVTASDGSFLNKIQIKWNTTSDEHMFEVWRSTEIDGPKTKMATTANAVFNDVTATCNNTYYYWVKRIDPKGIAGDFSNYDSGYNTCN